MDSLKARRPAHTRHTHTYTVGSELFFSTTGRHTHTHACTHRAAARFAIFQHFATGNRHKIHISRRPGGTPLNWTLAGGHLFVVVRVFFVNFTGVVFESGQLT